MDCYYTRTYTQGNHDLHVAKPYQIRSQFHHFRRIIHSSSTPPSLPRAPHTVLQRVPVPRPLVALVAPRVRDARILAITPAEVFLRGARVVEPAHVLVARAPLRRGETVLAEAPLFTQGLVRSDASVRAALAACSSEARDAFYQLHNCHSKQKCAPALGTFETNVLPCGGNDAHGHVAQLGGIFVTAARANASCVPPLWAARQWTGRLLQVARAAPARPV